MAKAKLAAFGAIFFYFLSLAPAFAQECGELWVCTDWSFCLGSGIQMRTCMDISRCGTEAGKPPETQMCVPSEPREAVLPQNPNEDTGVTGLLVSNTPAVLGAAIIILIAAVYILHRKSRDIRIFVSSP